MIIETLYVLYKAVTSDLVKGNEDAEKSTKKVSKEIKEQQGHTEVLGKSFKNLATEIAGTLGVAFTAGEFFRVMKDAADFGRTLSLNSNLLNINATELQAWGNVIQKVGGTAEQFQSDIQNLGQHFGVTPDTAFKLLPMLSDSLSRLNRLQAFTYGHSIGLSDQTIQMLRMGNTELSKMLNAQKELGLITEADVKQFTEFNNTVVDTKNAFTGLALSLVTDALPGLNKTFDTIKTGLVYLREHKSEVKDFFSVLGVFAVSALAALNPPLAIFAATVAGLIYAFKKLSEFEKEHPSAALNMNGAFYGNSFQDLISGKLKLHTEQMSTPVASSNSSMISSSSKTVNNSQTINIDKVVTNDATKFTKQLDPYNRSSSFMDYNSSNNQFATGAA